jgi:predicted Zn-dependent protease
MPDEPDSKTKGFQMSGRRAWLEIALISGGALGGVWLIVFFAGRAAGALSDYVPVDFDRAIGQAAWRASLTQGRCEDPRAQQYVEEVAAPLLRALGPTPYAFEFAVADDLAINAFALPGGFVTVNFGLLEHAESGDEIAAVLAHELQHVLERHGTRRILRQLGGSTVLYAVFGGTDVALPATVIGDLLSTAYDRNQEREADAGALSLMRKAGVDPMGMARFFERLAEQGGAPPALLSTHPDPGDRSELAARAAKGMSHKPPLPPPVDLRCNSK